MFGVIKPDLRFNNAHLTVVLGGSTLEKCAEVFNNADLSNDINIQTFNSISRENAIFTQYPIKKTLFTLYPINNA